MKVDRLGYTADEDRGKCATGPVLTCNGSGHPVGCREAMLIVIVAKTIYILALKRQLLDCCSVTNNRSVFAAGREGPSY